MLAVEVARQVEIARSRHAMPFFTRITLALTWMAATSILFTGIATADSVPIREIYDLSSGNFIDNNLDWCSNSQIAYFNVYDDVFLFSDLTTNRSTEIQARTGIAETYRALGWTELPGMKLSCVGAMVYLVLNSEIYVWNPRTSEILRLALREPGTQTVLDSNASSYPIRVEIGQGNREANKVAICCADKPVIDKQNSGLQQLGSLGDALPENIHIISSRPITVLSWSNFPLGDKRRSFLLTEHCCSGDLVETIDRSWMLEWPGETFVPRFIYEPGRSVDPLVVVFRGQTSGEGFALCLMNGILERAPDMDCVPLRIVPNPPDDDEFAYELIDMSIREKVVSAVLQRSVPTSDGKPEFCLTHQTFDVKSRSPALAWEGCDARLNSVGDLLTVKLAPDGGRYVAVGCKTALQKSGKCRFYAGVVNDQ